jgi:hypothetical protein
MSKVLPSSITIEEAVARMVNMDYIPAGFTLLEMIAAFQEEAEVDYYNAQIGRLPEVQMKKLKIRMDCCQSRHTLTQLLLESLQHEVKNPKGSMIMIADDSLSHNRLTLESVSDWAADRYGINIPISIPISSNNPIVVDESSQNFRWEDVTIKIWKDYKIGYSLKKGEFRRSNFKKIGLMGEVKNLPNQLGTILIGLSKGKNYPVGDHPYDKEKTAISKLRNALLKLTGLSEDPFFPINKSEGWKPKFTLINDENNAEVRAQKKAKFESFDETKHVVDTAY